MLWYVVVLVVALLAALFWWQWTSVERGVRTRDQRIFPIIESLNEQFTRGETPSQQEVDRVAEINYARADLYQLLKFFERLEMFPLKFRDEISQAETQLVYWMLHPNELQDPPEEIELLETVPRTVEEHLARFYVFRYRMPAGHWAGTDWTLGVAGPFIGEIPPYSGFAGAFSRCNDKQGSISPDELVNWFIEMCYRKSPR